MVSARQATLAAKAATKAAALAAAAAATTATPAPAPVVTAAATALTTAAIPAAATTASSAPPLGVPVVAPPYVRPHSKSAVKTVDLCDFAVTELIHDFGNIDPVQGISAGRYNDLKPVFDRIISDGLNYCGNSSSFIKYNEPAILEQIAGANFKANIGNGTLNNKNITVSTGQVYNVRISSRTENKLNAAGDDDDSECGIKTFDALFGTISGDNYPILLIDTDLGVTKDLKIGDSGTITRKIYIFSPVVVRADSASKMNLNDKPTLKKNFVNTSGIQLINIMDKSPFTASVATNKDNVGGFFSKYTVRSYESGSNIDQSWSGFTHIGTGTGAGKAITRVDVNETNNRTSVANKIDPIINRVPGTDKTGPNNMLKPNVQEQTKLEIFNSEIQAKRSGDWLPVSYILQYMSHTKDLKTYTDPSNPASIVPFIAPAKFIPANMYIVTIDQPLVAYALYSGVNVIFCNENRFIRLKKMP